MIQLSKQADYGLVIMHFLRKTSPAAFFSASQIAREIGLPVPMVSKILKLLNHHGFLKSVLGAKGGYQLGPGKDHSRVIDIIEALDDPIALTQCTLHESSGECKIETSCELRKPWKIINERVRAALSDITIADFAPEAESKLADFSGNTAGKAHPLKMIGDTLENKNQAI